MNTLLRRKEWIALLLVLGWALLWLVADRQRSAPDPYQLLPGPRVPVAQAEPDFLDRRLGSGVRSPGWAAWRRMHRLEGRFRQNHNLHRLLDNNLLETEPEWFPLLNGRRHPLSGGKGPQPNLASPGFARHVADQARTFWEENPEERSFSISITDSIAFDESAATLTLVEPRRTFRRRPDYSDLVFTFSQRVAEEVFGEGGSEQEAGSRAADPHPAGWFAARDREVTGTYRRYLTAYAYFWAENVPSFVQTGYPPPSALSPQPTSLHPRLLPFLTSDRAQWWHPEYRENDRDLIARWGRAGTEMIGGRDYYNGQAYFIPRYYPSLVAEFIPYLYEHNGRAYYAEGRPIWGYQAPLYWLTAQLLWDTSQDVAALQARFFRTMYGPAAGEMRRFFDRCEEIWMNQEGHWQWIKYFKLPSQAELFPPETGAELEALLDAAYAAVGGDPHAAGTGVDEKPSVWSTHSLYRARVALTREAFTFTRRATELYHLWKAAASNPLVTGADQIRFAADLKRWEQAHRVLAETVDIAGPDPRWSPRDRLLQLDPSQRRLSPQSDERRLEFSLRGSLLPGDTLGIDPWDLKYARLSNDWLVSLQPYEGFSLQRVARAGPDGDGDALQIRGSNYLSLFRWHSVDADTWCSSRLRIRGKVSPGVFAGLSLYFVDENRQILGKGIIDEIPPGLHREWVPLTVRAQAPPGTRRAFVSFRILYQAPGDWLLIGEGE